MPSGIIKFFRSYEMFIKFQLGIRRRILDCHHFLNSNLIKRKLAKALKTNCDDKETDQIFRLICLPQKITVGEREKNELKNFANNSVEGVFNLLGSGSIKLDPIDWHTDFKTGYKWKPGIFYRRYAQEEINSSSDVKIPRELSRCHHLLKLGLIYRLTKDEKFAKTSIDHILNWIDNNPLMFSINWGCTMDVAIRSVNWIWALALLQGSSFLNREVIRIIKGSLYQHGWFIWRNPEKEPVYSANHYLADIAGQIYLGLLFQGIKEADLWLEKGKHELFREIRIEILPSGMSYERSTNYNRLVIELILYPILLLRNSGHEIPMDIWYRLEKMFEFVMYSLKPDGTSPIIGDQDNGRLLPFGVEDLNDFRYLLSIGALLYNRPDFKAHGDGFNVYCSILGGDDALERWRSIKSCSANLESRAFHDVGIYILRSKGDYLLLNASGKGLYPELGVGTHTHSDLLSFELFTHGKTFLVDPGSYIYSADAEARMMFRSTYMHNTVVIDGVSQDEILKDVLWDFKRKAIPKVTKWESNYNHDLISASHSGYSRLNDPVLHERSLSYIKKTSLWIIRDSFTGNDKHKFEWFFHFNTGIDFKIYKNVVETKCTDGKNILIDFEPKTGLIFLKKDSCVSKSYGVKEHGYVLIASINATAPFELSIEISKS